MPSPAIQQLWQAYLATLPEPYHTLIAQQGYTADAWGDNPALADELGGLIAAGVKTATCGALWDYEATGDPIPTVGQKTIVLDGRGAPLCVIETTEITIRAFNAIDAQFAYEEGEDDRTLASWRTEHQRYFTRTLAASGRTFDETMPLVCERFRLLYPKPAGRNQLD